MKENHIELTIDGNAFSSYKEFCTYFSKNFLKQKWNGNLDAFEDLLFQRFGLPHDQFTIKWINSNRSREILGIEETALWYKERIKNCHPSNIEIMKLRLEKVLRGEEKTLFDVLVDIIKESETNGGLILLLN